MVPCLIFNLGAINTIKEGVSKRKINILFAIKDGLCMTGILLILFFGTSAQNGEIEYIAPIVTIYLLCYLNAGFVIYNMKRYFNFKT